MFLQGTASVYSKKVELLWQTVLKMLDTLASKRALEEAEASGEGEEDGSKSGRKKKGPLLDGNSFNLISLEVSRINQESISKNQPVRPECDLIRHKDE